MKQLLLVLWVIFVTGLHAQNSGDVTIIDFAVNPGGVVKEFGNPNYTSKANTLYLSDWSIGSITTHSSTRISNIPLRYDFLNGTIEIRTENSIVVCPYTQFIEFEFLVSETGNTRIFVNQFEREDIKDIGLFPVIELLYKSNWQLGFLHYAYHKPSTYVMAFDMGEKGSDTTIKSRYCVNDGENWLWLSKRLKSNKDLLGDDFDKVKSFLKNERLTWYGSKDEMITILNYLESIK
jgi:hypothetical protein